MAVKIDFNQLFLIAGNLILVHTCDADSVLVECKSHAKNEGFPKLLKI